MFTCINPVFGTMPNRVPLNDNLRPKTDRNLGSDFWEAIVTDSIHLLLFMIEQSVSENMF